MPNRTSVAGSGLFIADKYRGAFLCDGVGLGKTFIGMMVIEYSIERQRKRVALLVPKAAGEAVVGEGSQGVLTAHLW